MPRYVVQILDTTAPSAVEPDIVCWTVEAESHDAAVELGYKAWDHKYGRRPIAPQVTVERLDSGPGHTR
jgi:hypothetical protein